MQFLKLCITKKSPFQQWEMQIIACCCFFYQCSAAAAGLEYGKCELNWAVSPNEV